MPPLVWPSGPSFGINQPGTALYSNRTPLLPANAPLQLGKSLLALFAAALVVASVSAEICSTSFHLSTEILSLAAIDPSLAVQSVSTSRRRVGWLMLLVQISCPSLPSSQLTKTLVALGWGRFLMTTKIPD